MYGKPPILVYEFPLVWLPEVMYYLYLPVAMGGMKDIRLPPALETCRPLVEAAVHMVGDRRYVYLSARKGWATPDSPLNRPGWHCDGFGTKDLNFVWWHGPGTRFAIQKFGDISTDHKESQAQFEQQVKPNKILTPPEHGLFLLDHEVVHSTPIIAAPGCMRQYIKVSLSDHRYDLENNSHNWMFNYNWPMHERESVRNDTHRAQQDHA